MVKIQQACILVYPIPPPAHSQSCLHKTLTMLQMWNAFMCRKSGKSKAIRHAILLMYQLFHLAYFSLQRPCIYYKEKRTGLKLDYKGHGIQIFLAWTNFIKFLQCKKCYSSPWQQSSLCSCEAIWSLAPAASSSPLLAMYSSPIELDSRHRQKIHVIC